MNDINIALYNDSSFRYVYIYDENGYIAINPSTYQRIYYKDESAFVYFANNSHIDVIDKIDLILGTYEENINQEYLLVVLKEFLKHKGCLECKMLIEKSISYLEKILKV